MTLAKDVKKGKTIYKIFEVKKVEDASVDGEMALQFTITTDTRDRDKDIVDPSGILVDNYAGNPVMLWAHQYDSLPVAKSVQMWSAQKLEKAGSNDESDGEIVAINGVKSRVVFQPDSNYHESYSGIRGSMVYRMYQTGFLHAVSIGFDPQEWEEIEEKDTESLGGSGTKFLKWDLLEFSAVPVPANPQALIDRDFKGEDAKRFKKQIKTWATEALEKCECSEKSSPSESKELDQVDKIDETELPLVTDDTFVEEVKAIIIKAGRVLSTKNESDLKDGVAQINAGVEMVNGVLAKVQSGGEPSGNTGSTEPPKGSEVSEIKTEAEPESSADEPPAVKPAEEAEPPKPETAEEPTEDIYVIDETVWSEELQAYITLLREEAAEEPTEASNENQTDLAQREET